VEALDQAGLDGRTRYKVTEDARAGTVLSQSIAPGRAVSGSKVITFTVARAPKCSSSYPGVCIRPPPPDLDCADVSAENFEVVGSDPHGLDGDGDGVGCETGGGGGGGPGGWGGGGASGCDPSYPTVCIPPYPPDLDCADVSYTDFAVAGSDPHGFDGDGDGVGCES